MNFKKTTIFIIISLLMFSSITYAKTNFFNDVPKDAWYKSAVDSVSGYGVMVGNGDGNFRPNDNVTRAEAAQISNNIINLFHNEIQNLSTNDELVINTVVKKLPSSVIVQAGQFMGSGFFISDNKVITNAHVVSDSKDGLCNVTLFSGKALKGKIIKSDKLRDLALIEVEKQPNIDNISYALDSKVGETVLVIGNPRGFYFSVSKGIISHLNRVIIPRRYIQVDAAINSGNSGGMIIDVRGNLVGIAAAKIVDVGVEGLNFGIPAEDVKKFVESN